MTKTVKEVDLIKGLLEAFDEKFYYPRMGEYALGRHEVTLTVEEAKSFLEAEIRELIKEAIGEMEEDELVGNPIRAKIRNDLRKEILSKL